MRAGSHRRCAPTRRSRTDTISHTARQAVTSFSQSHRSSYDVPLRNSVRQQARTIARVCDDEPEWKEAVGGIWLGRSDRDVRTEHGNAITEVLVLIELVRPRPQFAARLAHSRRSSSAPRATSLRDFTELLRGLRGSHAPSTGTPSTRTMKSGVSRPPDSLGRVLFETFSRLSELQERCYL